MFASIVTVAAIAVAASSAAPATFVNVGQMPGFTLKNAAQENVVMPAVGLGTGGYNSNPANPASYPECWNENTGCGSAAQKAVNEWLTAGGRRLDCANSYFNMKSVGQGIKNSGVAREEIFILHKTGPSFPLGYQDTLDQWEEIKAEVGVDYVDLLLIHWPYRTVSQGNVTHNATVSKDPACNHNLPTFDASQCRVNTWKAMLTIFATGGAKAVGVSNFEISDLQDLIDANMTLPAVNQCPFHIYRSSTQAQLRDFCSSHNILFNGYSPLGVPDWHAFPGPDMSVVQLEDPEVVAISKTHGVTPAQVLLAWQFHLGIPTNPRSMNVTHMKENMDIFDIQLSSDEINTLNTRPQAYCTVDPHFYECAKNSTIV